LGFGEGPALHGFGDERPSGAELGVLETGVGAVGAESEVLEVDIRVNGEPLVCGELSFIRADLGGTSGGVLSDLSLEFEFCRINRCG
jgi:hypothetical protein